MGMDFAGKAKWNAPPAIYSLAIELIFHFRRFSLVENNQNMGKLMKGWAIAAWFYGVGQFSRSFSKSDVVHIFKFFLCPIVQRLITLCSRPEQAYTFLLQRCIQLYNVILLLYFR